MHGVTVFALHFVIRAMGDMIKLCPLSNIRATPPHGNVIILFDCNSFGETDVQPDIRACPIPREVVAYTLNHSHPVVSIVHPLTAASNEPNIGLKPFS